MPRKIKKEYTLSPWDAMLSARFPDDPTPVTVPYTVTTQCNTHSESTTQCNTHSESTTSEDKVCD